jgi:hypothetical protein
MCSTLVVGTNVGVSKDDQLKVLVVRSTPHTLLVFDEEIFLLSLVVEVQC